MTHMAPEVFTVTKKRRIDLQADIFSFGVSALGRCPMTRFFSGMAGSVAASKRSCSVSLFMSPLTAGFGSHRQGLQGSHPSRVSSNKDLIRCKLRIGRDPCWPGKAVKVSKVPSEDSIVCHCTARLTVSHQVRIPSSLLLPCDCCCRPRRRCCCSSLLPLLLPAGGHVVPVDPPGALPGPCPQHRLPTHRHAGCPHGQEGAAGCPRPRGR